MRNPFVISGMGRCFALVLLALSASGESLAKTDLFVFGSLGEAPYWQLSDVAGSTVVPQAGLQTTWRMKYGGPRAEASVGRYYAGSLYEAFLGLEGGMDIWKVRPSLNLGYGVQSANRRDYPSESDAYDLVRETHFPVGLGIRLDLFDRAFVGLDARTRGALMWRFAVGWRWARLRSL